MRKKVLRNHFLALTIPLILQNILHILMQHIDLMMLGQLSNVAVAAAGLVNGLFFILFMVFIAMSFSFFSLMAQYFGNRQQDDFEALIMTSSLVATLIGGLIFLTFEPILALLLKSWGVEPAVVNAGVEYGAGLNYCFLILGATLIIETALKACGQTALDFHIKLISVILNIALNYVLIFGYGDITPMGIYGAGLATSLSRLVALLLMILAALFGISKFRLRLGAALDFRPAAWRQALRFGKILLIQDVFWSGALLLYSRAFAVYGTEILAVYSLVYLIDRLADSVCMAFSWATGILVGNDLGAGYFSKAKYKADLGLGVGAQYSIVLCIALILLSPSVLVFYPFDLNQQELFYQMILIHACILFVKMVGIIILVGVLRTGGDFFVTAVMELGCMYFISVPLTLIGALVFGLSPWVIYGFICLEWLVKGVLMVIRYRQMHWLKRLI